MSYRVCAFGVVEPTRILFGRVYGVCALKEECPPGECGYARSRRIIATYGEHAEEREYDPNVAPCDDAEFGAKP